MTDSSDHRTRPTHTAYAVRDFTNSTGEPDSSWMRIGVAFMHRDGYGFDVKLDALPVNGRVVLRTIVSDDMKRLLRATKAAARTGR